jgi:ligand-binding sensor domain-containing protein
MTCSNSGVFRVPHPERLAERLPVRVNDRRISKTSEVLQNFTSKDGLSSDSGAPVLEDREGNIWVATRDGLDQFRDGALVPIALPKSLIRVAIAPADGGDLWGVGSWAYVARIRADSSNISLVPADAFKAYRDAAGVTWLLGDSLEQWKDMSAGVNVWSAAFPQAKSELAGWSAQLYTTFDGEDFSWP